MKNIPVRKEVKRTYVIYDCGCGHNHQNFDIAQKCMNKKRRPKNIYKKRNRQIVLLVLDGTSYKDVAHMFDLSIQRIRQIFMRQIRVALHPCYKKFISDHRHVFFDNDGYICDVVKLRKNSNEIKEMMATVWNNRDSKEL